MKTLKYLAAAALALLAVGCAKESEQLAGPSNVTFEISTPEIATKAIGDGMTATKLYYQVFDAEGNVIDGLGVQNKDLESGKTTVSFQLVKDQKYNFIFWAQTPVDGYYTIDGTEGLKKITADYEGKNSNDENFDAFFAVEKALTINGPITKTITLKRPFAQINIATTDILKAGDTKVNVNFTGATSAVTVKGVPTVFSPLTDEFSVSVNAQFASAAIPEGNFSVTGSTDTYKYLAVNYVFAPVDGTVYDVEAAFNVDGKDVTVKVPSAPAKRNYRTNIYGNLLTATADFNVVVDPGFAGEENISPIIVNGVAYQTLDAAVAAAKTGEQTIIALSQDMAGNGVKTIKGQDVVIDLGGHTFDIDGSLVGSTGTVTSGFQLLKGSKVTFKNGTLKSKKASLLIQNYSDLTLEDVTLDATGGAARYVLSNNHGTVKILGSTSILAPEGKHAFDVYYWPPAYSDGVNVYVNTTGIIRGAIEYAFDKDEDACNIKTSLVIENARLEDSKFETKLLTPNMKIARSLFVDEAAAVAWIPAGYKLMTDGDYYSIVDGSVTMVASQEGLNAAIADVAEGETATVYLGAGEYDLIKSNCKGDIVVKGKDKATTIVRVPDESRGYDNKSISFENLTFNCENKYLGDKRESQFPRTDVHFTNCNINGLFAAIGSTTTSFKECTFTASDYAIKYYGGPEASKLIVEKCQFNTCGKGILMFNEAAYTYAAEVVNCTFTASATISGKAAVQMHTEKGIKGNLSISGSTATGFDSSINGGLWNEVNNTTKERTTNFNVTVDGTPVQAAK